ncbi:PRC-barrel domain containing protein [Sphingomonas suaedae]|uniref:PRC-barrel domain containing protein n=2 Tax=Sphingomonas suaedae TaxID=2599297 RepID=A0A518RL58_9SPHN|nr:PRC-barrel domain containing protein [Sphingomonas suaedae]
MANHDTDTLARDETTNMISSEKVDGTAVYDRNGDKIGSVHHLMIGKQDGKVRYGVISFGGFLGMGENYHPLPWDMLTYGIDHDGYMVDFDKDALKDAPSHPIGQEPIYDRAYDERVTTYYGQRR